jgi:hypothetical protein
MPNTDHLGREIATDTPEAGTVTEFAVQQGTLDADAPGVQDSMKGDQRRRKEGTERAERVSQQMAPTEDPTPVPTEEGGGRG